MVFVFLGLPSSSLLPSDTDAASRELGLRVIAVDRPGLSDASFQKDRTIVDWPRDVGIIAAQIGADRFGVLGVSAGTPYALVCAWAEPERVAFAHVVTAVAPPDRPDSPLGELSPQESLAYYEAINASRVADPRAFAEAMSGGVSGDGDLNAFLVANVQDAFRQGPAGVAHDLWLLVHPWGFRPEAIVRPVRIWHAADDVAVSVDQAEYLADVIPGASLEVWPTGNHAAAFAHWPAVLRAAADAWATDR